MTTTAKGTTPMTMTTTAGKHSDWPASVTRMRWVATGAGAELRIPRSSTVHASVFRSWTKGAAGASGFHFSVHVNGLIPGGGPVAWCKDSDSARQVARELVALLPMARAEQEAQRQAQHEAERERWRAGAQPRLAQAVEAAVAEAVSMGIPWDTITATVAQAMADAEIHWRNEGDGK